MRKTYLLLPIILIIITGCQQVPPKYQDRSYCEQTSDCSPEGCGCFNQYYKSPRGMVCGVNPQTCDCMNNTCVSLCRGGYKIGETWEEGGKFCKCTKSGNPNCK